MELETSADQQEQRAEVALAEPQPLAPPHGRPWVKGLSGNPAGRPRRLDQVAAQVREQTRGAALVAENLIAENTVPVIHKLVALAGDRTALRLCLERISPPRRGTSLATLLPVELGGDARAAIAVVADAAAAGVITSAQGAMLARTLMTVLCATRD